MEMGGKKAYSARRGFRIVVWYVFLETGIFVNIITNLYNGATTEFVTPHGHTHAIGIMRDTLQGDPLSPLLFDLMIEPFIRWLNASHKGYDMIPCGLRLAIK